ncbi:MAG: hypothetical protein KJT03_05255 [Verrucomicrobiae bacterium]|nr:hypothetical protein [Verrucomicrobiae bacterium]
MQLKLPADIESRRILGKSTVFQDLNRELEAIEKFKWLESEKAGKDIGYEKALFRWIHAHRISWRSQRLRIKKKKRS